MAIRTSSQEAIQEASHENITAHELDIVVSNARQLNQVRDRQIQYMDEVHQHIEDRISESES